MPPVKYDEKLVLFFLFRGTGTNNKHVRTLYIYIYVYFLYIDSFFFLVTYLRYVDDSCRILVDLLASKNRSLASSISLG